MSTEHKPQREPLAINQELLVSELERAERGLADAERIIEARTGKGSWVGSLILASVRDVLKSQELLERIAEVAGSTAMTDLWCSEAQKLLYDCRDEIERLTNTKPVRPYVTPPYCDEPGGSHGLDSR